MKILKPDLILESIFAIDLTALNERGIRGLLLDVDNTLVGWKQTEVEEKLLEWIDSAKKKGFKLCLVSNALAKRAQSFAELLDIPGVGRAFKPFSRAFLQGLKLLQLAPSQAAVIGDQLFTDVFGGNRLGLYTILINPLSREELGTTKLMRKLERRVLAAMAKRGQISPLAWEIRQNKE